MSKKIVAFAADHAGFQLKQSLMEAARGADVEVLDLGTDSGESVDYPDFANKLAVAVQEKKAQLGVLICGSGIGMSIAANRHKGIRAALCHDVTTAYLASAHNNANVLCLGARITGEQVAKDCLIAFLEAEFEGGRHQRRVDKLG